MQNDFNILTVDVGNSFVKFAHFLHGEIIEFHKKESLNAVDLEAYCIKNNIDGIAYSASGDDDPEVLNYIQNFPRHIFLHHTTNMPIDIKYETPETLGIDRIAAVLGAYHLYPNRNCIVVDFGTCITFELLNKDAAYLGGNIAPGVQMRLNAMHHFTDRLPLVDIQGDDDWIGTSTESAIRNGAVLGTILEVESFIYRAKKFFDDAVVLFTGGGAKYLVDKFKFDIHHNPYLIHLGLYEILKYNEENE